MTSINPGPAASGFPNTAAQLATPLPAGTPIPNGLTYAQLVAQYPAAQVNGNPVVVTSDLGVVWWNGTVWVSSTAPQGLNNGFFNFTTQNTQRLRAAIARVRSNRGSATMKVAMVADSCFAGYDGVGVNSGYPGGRAYSVPVQLAAILSAKGLAAQADNMFGNNNVGNAAAYTAYYPAAVLTNWPPTVLTSVPSLGAFSFQSTTLGANIAFTPVTAFDTIDVYFLQAAGNGSFTVNVDGGATLATIATAGGSAYVKQTISGVTHGTHTINLTTTSATTTFVNAVCVRDSTIPRVEIYNMGFDAVTAAIYATTVGSWNLRVALPVVAPDLTIIQLTINDINLNTGVSTYTAATQALISAALVSGDCVIAVGNPCGPANWNNGINVGYQNALYALALANNIPLIDITARWISYAAANAVMPYFDTSFLLHPGGVGYADIASVHSLLFQ